MPALSGLNSLSLLLIHGLTAAANQCRAYGAVWATFIQSAARTATERLLQQSLADDNLELHLATDILGNAMLHRYESNMEYQIRLARPSDIPAISNLIASSARGLSRDEYTGEQIEAAVNSIFGVDSELISDRTYFVAEAEGQLIGCGGWSHRRTLFGGDQAASRQTGVLDSARDAAKIRAFFIDPKWARRGVGRAILERCEKEARRAGFQAAELMSTLPGLGFYRAMGYEASEPLVYPAGAVELTFVPMRKQFGEIPAIGFAAKVGEADE